MREHVVVLESYVIYRFRHRIPFESETAIKVLSLLLRASSADCSSGLGAGQVGSSDLGSLRNADSSATAIRACWELARAA